MKDGKTQRDRTISIHALRVEGDSDGVVKDDDAPQISIHALRVEGDILIAVEEMAELTFLSTPSVWRATRSGRTPF